MTAAALLTAPRTTSPSDPARTVGVRPMAVASQAAAPAAAAARMDRRDAKVLMSSGMVGPPLFELAVCGADTSAVATVLAGRRGDDDTTPMASAADRRRSEGASLVGSSSVVALRPGGGHVRSRQLSDVGGWEAFLHGVFSISITLLALDIRVPTVEGGMETGADLVNALVAEWPNYLAYVLGFLYIGTYWIATHRTLRMLRGIDHWFIVLGLLFLMILATVPFVTALLAEYIGADNGRDKVALVVFTGWQLLLSLLANLELRYAAHDGRLLKPGLDQQALRRWLRLAAIGPVVWIVALVAAVLVSGTITLILMGVLVVLFLQEVPLGTGEGLAE